MNAYGEYSVLLANARLDDLRRETERLRLARLVAPPRRRWGLPWRRQVQPRPVVALPERPGQPAQADLRRSA